MHIRSQIPLHILLEGENELLIRIVYFSAVQEMIHPVCQQLHFIKRRICRNIHHCIGYLSLIRNDEHNSAPPIKREESHVIEFPLSAGRSCNGKRMRQRCHRSCNVTGDFILLCHMFFQDMVDHGLFIIRYWRRLHQPVYIEAVSLDGRNPACRCMRLFQVSFIFQVLHFVTDRSAADAQIVLAGNGS